MGLAIFINIYFKFIGFFLKFITKERERFIWYVRNIYCEMSHLQLNAFTFSIHPLCWAESRKCFFALPLGNFSDDSTPPKKVIEGAIRCIGHFIARFTLETKIRRACRNSEPGSIVNTANGKMM
jgi:hypothetical protein